MKNDVSLFVLVKIFSHVLSFYVKMAFLII